MTPQESDPDLTMSVQESLGRQRSSVACCRVGGTECSSVSWDLLKEVPIILVTSIIGWPQVNNREGTQLCPSTENYIKDLLSMALPIRTRTSFRLSQSLPPDVKEMAQYADSISVCLSKGLCAPVGSVLVGPKDFIDLARRKRKVLGGGMRQAGILAAAGIVALTEMTDRLQEDHDNAAYMAERLTEVKGLEVYKERQQIDMVFFRLKDYPLDSDQLVEYMAKHGVIINGEDNGMMRFVSHAYVSREEIDKVIELMKQAQ